MVDKINTDNLKELGRDLDPNYDLRERLRRLREKQAQQQMPEQELPEDRSDLYQLGATLNQIATGSDALQPLAQQLSQGDIANREAALRDRLLARQDRQRTEEQLGQTEQQLFGRDQTLERQGIEDERYETEQQRQARLEAKQDERYETEQQRQARLDADNRKVQQRKLQAMDTALKDDKNLRDPNSVMSKMYRDIYTKEGIEFPENASAYELQKLSPLLDSQIKARFELQKEQLKQQGKKPGLTKAQEEVDKEFGKDYAKYISGGSANMETNIAKLDDVAKTLAEGGISGNAQGLVPESWESFVTPKAKAVQEAIESVVQQSLRETLGAQFTEKEAAQLMKRSYNPALSEEENIKRVMALRDQLVEAKKRKEAAYRYYEQNGTLAGFEGKPITIELFNADTEPMKKEVKSDKVKIRSPRGTIHMIPRSAVEGAVAAGGEVIND
jgi:hypothetical protein